MTTFDPFLRGKIEQSDLCCGEQPQKPHEPKVHVVPALSTTAPAWSGIAIIDLEMKEICLKDYKGKYLILLFYPYDFTFICPTEIIQFNDRVEEFNKLGIRYSSLIFFPLLSSFNFEIENKLNILLCSLSFASLYFVQLLYNTKKFKYSISLEMTNRLRGNCHFYGFSVRTSSMDHYTPEARWSGRNENTLFIR